MSGISDILGQLKAENRFRSVPGPVEESYFDLSSNDYLGLAERYDEYIEEFQRRFPDAGFTSSASRLLSTRQKYHHRLESLLASLYGKEALLFNSGYHANVGCIGALTLPSTLFICDKLIHASIVDGLKINSAEYKRFPHNDLRKLEKILQKESESYERIVVVVESIYSMDGDEAPLRELVELKRRYPSMLLYVDEAHAFGVRGKRGLGLCEELDTIKETDILIGTFGKAAASMGAFAIVSEELKQLLVNFARPFIFSTALPPANVAWSILMTEKIVGMQEERRHLQELGAYFASRIQKIALRQSAPSHIIPLLTGDASRAIEMAVELRKNGILALPIRRPTVPPGGERIRFSLSASMTMEKLGRVADILEEISHGNPR